MRVDDERWRQFFARFDIYIIVSVSWVLLVFVGLWVMRKRLEAVWMLAILPALVFTVALPKFFVDRARPEGPPALRLGSQTPTFAEH